MDKDAVWRSDLLEGKVVDLRVLEREDLARFGEWVNNPDFYGEYDILEQRAKSEIEKKFENSRLETWKFLILKKDGTGIGIMSGELHSDYGGFLEIGFNIVPDEKEGLLF